MDAQRHEEAITEYSAALSLDPTSLQGLIKRSKGSVARGLWEDGLRDADKVRPLFSRRLVLVDGTTTR